MDGDTISLRDCPGVISFIDSGDLAGLRFVNDSRVACRGDIFVAINGRTTDGHNWARMAVENGCAGVVAEHPIAGLHCPVCVVSDSRLAWAWLKLAEFGNPHRKLRISGVTGTNGKTTVTWILRSILQSAGIQTGLSGTIEYSDGRQNRSSDLTTPDAGELARLFREMRNARSTDCILEISSHALDQKRCIGFRLATAALTSISQDHLDYHETLDRYRDCKLQIAELLETDQPLLVNLDDPGCREALPRLKEVPVITYGEAEAAELRISARTSTADGQRIRLELDCGPLEIETQLYGAHNAGNLAAAIGMARQLGLEPAQIQQGLARMKPIPGRMQRLDGSQPFQVFIDFAHTPDALSGLLQAGRQFTSGRLLLVFGAGGDRDRSKRPRLAQAACAADEIFVTSDNPRSESPLRIIEEVCRGFGADDQFHRIVDRREAIAAALNAARPGDTVLIAGRGHETTQYIGTREIAFSDQRVTQRLLLDLIARNASDTVGA